MNSMLPVTRCEFNFKKQIWIGKLILISIFFSGNALSCKETFSLLYYEFDAATREPPPWDAERYKLVGKFLAFIIYPSPKLDWDTTHYAFCVQQVG